MQRWSGLQSGLGVGDRDEVIYNTLSGELVRYASALVGPDDGPDLLSAVITRVLSGVDQHGIRRWCTPEFGLGSQLGWFLELPVEEDVGDGAGRDREPELEEPVCQSGESRVVCRNP